MESNLKTHAIVSSTIGGLVKDLNTFSETNVDVRYTQTHPSGGKWYAVVFYYPLEDKPIPEVPIKEPKKDKGEWKDCPDCGSHCKKGYITNYPNSFYCKKCQKEFK